MIEEFRELESGTLHIRSRYADAELLYWDPNQSGIRFVRESRASGYQRRTIYAIRFANGTAYQFVPDFALDAPGPAFIHPGTPVTCLPMSALSDTVNALSDTNDLQHEMTKALYALGLRPSGSSSHTFERVGLFLLEATRGDDIDVGLKLLSIGPKEVEVL
jgi:hypothetical protein